MPYVWVPEKRRIALAVYPELPSGYVEVRFPFSVYREARTSDWEYMYFCSRCQGWLKGHPHTHEENTLAPLSGRSGWVWECQRCGEELGFEGIIS